MNIDTAELEKARDKCLDRLELYEPRDGYCNETWDGTVCWDETPANVVARQGCPQFVLGISKTGRVTRECGPDGFWAVPEGSNATDGWSNYTDCFKPDPTLAGITNHLEKIQLMTNIGYGISLVSLSVAVLIMFISRRLHCKSNSLHINLFIAFILRASVSFMKDLLFVDGLGLQKDVTRNSVGEVVFIHSGSHWECKLLVTMFMYAFSASLMWIFMEGLYLHMLVYKTLFTERTGIRMYVLIGWVSPFLYVIPWMLIRVYLDNTLCWNIDELGFIWIIKAPIILTILINFLFFVNIVRVLCDRMKTHRNASGNQQIRKLAKFSLVLIPLFGVLYIGFAAYPHGINVQADIVYLYCEMFYNSFQGLVLAILFCFLNEEVHNEIRRCWYRHTRSDNAFSRTMTLTTYRKASNMSHTTSAASANAHAYKDGGMGVVGSTKYQCCKKYRDKNENQNNPLIATKKVVTIVDNKKDCRGVTGGSVPLKNGNAYIEREQLCPLME